MKTLAFEVARVESQMVTDREEIVSDALLEE